MLPLGQLPQCMEKRLVALLALVAGYFHAQTPDSAGIAISPAKKWFETFAVRGYVQARYNRLLETNDDLSCEQCDRSWGKNGGISLRRVRIIFFGQLHERVYFTSSPFSPIRPPAAARAILGSCATPISTLASIKRANTACASAKAKFPTVSRTCSRAKSAFPSTATTP